MEIGITAQVKGAAKDSGLVGYDHHVMATSGRCVPCEAIHFTTA